MTSHLHNRSSAPDDHAPVKGKHGELAEFVCERRRLTGQPRGGPWWGLALSGGGIRSATFCLGMIRSLARARLFCRFDLMSTVSGGGFIGAAVGAMFHRAAFTEPTQNRSHNTDCERPEDERRARGEAVEKSIDAFEDLSFIWLRRHGRYLVSAGMADLRQAAAIMLRNLVALHIEFALLSILLGSALALINLAVWRAMEAWPGLQFLAHAPATVIWALPLVVFWYFVCACAYWVTCPADRDAPTWHTATLWTAVTVLSIAGLVVLWRKMTPDFSTGLALGGLLFGAACWLLGRPIGYEMMRRAREHPAPSDQGRATEHLAPSDKSAATETAHPETAPHGSLPENPARVRNKLTRFASTALMAAGATLLVAALDRAAWWLAFDAHLGLRPAWLIVIAAVLRALLPLVGNWFGAGRTRWLLSAGNVAGWLLAFLLAALWISLLDRLVYGALFDGPERDYGAAALTAGIALAVSSFYVLVTGNQLSFLNLSSLHPFYLARLTRSYLGASNPARTGDRSSSSIGDPHSGDDIPLRTYAPHKAGAPVHLINVCANRTADTAAPDFNADRRGEILSFGPEGMWRHGKCQRSATGCTRGAKRCDRPCDERGWQQMSPTMETGTLAQWTAVSGAAFSTGLGAMTRTGLSTLALFAGVRLGYWWPSCTVRARLAEKSRDLVDEARGHFSLNDNRYWYLSDGGHFENTGAYALLRERCEFIVLVDCGADPDYRFADLENLVRKARIDLDVDFEPMVPKLHAPNTIRPHFGSLDDLRSEHSQACMSLWRICYPGKESAGWLLIAKPNMASGLPADVENYRLAHPDFPQQSTLDQWFDEAQWESYRLLGETIGRHLANAITVGLPENAAAWFEPESHAIARRDKTMASRANATQFNNGSPVTSKSGLTDATQSEKGVIVPASLGSAAERGVTGSRLAARLGGAPSVARTVGIGALIAAIWVPAWQALEDFRSSRARNVEATMNALREVSTKFGQTGNPGNEEVVSELAAALVRVHDRLCAGGRDDGETFRNTATGPTALFWTIKQCEDPGAPFSCQPLLRQVRSGCLAQSSVPSHAEQPVYWVYEPENERKAMQRRAAESVEPGLIPRAGWTPGSESTSRTSVALNQLNSCDGFTVYVQYYASIDEHRSNPNQMRAIHLLEDWRKAAGDPIPGRVKLPAAENVWATDIRQTRPLRQPVNSDELRVSARGPDPKPCGASLKSIWPSGGQHGLKTIENSRVRPGTIEVWLAREEPAPPAKPK